MKKARLVGKCIACGKRFEITPILMREAESAGCAISPCCNFPSTVVGVDGAPHTIPSTTSMKTGAP